MEKKIVSRKVYVGDKPPSPWQRTQQRLKIIRRHLDKSDAAIGKMFGVTRAAIFELRMRYNIPKVRSNTQHRQRVFEQVRKLPTGLTIAAAAEKLLPKAAVKLAPVNSPNVLLPSRLLT